MDRRRLALSTLSVVIAAGAVVSFWPGTSFAKHAAGATCKPPIVTRTEVAKAIDRPTVQVELSPLPSIGGYGDGRASLFVFASAPDAKRWFTAYTARETTPCKKKTFAAAACAEVLPYPAGAFPLFQAVQGRYAVWIHVVQKRVDLGALEALAGKVLAHAPRAA